MGGSDATDAVKKETARLKRMKEARDRKMAKANQALDRWMNRLLRAANAVSKARKEIARLKALNGQ